MTAHWIFRSIRAHALILSVAALLLAFGVLADDVVEGETLAVDKAVLLMLRTPGNPADPIGPSWLQEAARDVTALGSFSVLALVTIGVVLTLLFMRRRLVATFVLGAVLGGIALSSSLKALFDRPRPDLTGVVTVFTSSFPSGHATVSAVVFLTLGVCLMETTDDTGLKRFYLGYAAFLTGIVGISRIYLGVHYPTDVVAGWAIGTAWALLCWVGMRGWLHCERQGLRTVE